MNSSGEKVYNEEKVDWGLNPGCEVWGTLPTRVIEKGKDLELKGAWNKGDQNENQTSVVSGMLKHDNPQKASSHM